MKNPFSSAKIVAKNYDSRLYIRQEFKRGDKSFVMSRSELMEFVICPSRWRRGYRESDDRTASTDWGQMIDCLLFEPSIFADKFAIKPETYPSEKEGEKPWSGNSKWCKQWLEDHADKICIKPDAFESAASAVQRIRDDETCQAILASADFQVYITAEYRDEKTGVVVPVKALIDIVPHEDRFLRSLMELKTARDANPARWGRTVNDRAYHVQAAFFTDCYNAATGDERFEFRSIVSENFPPFEISKNLLSDEFLEFGRTKYLNALRLYAHCIATNHWPGYDDLHPENFNGWSLIQPSEWMAEGDPNWQIDAETPAEKQSIGDDILH